MNTARILASIAKNPDAPNYRIAKNLGLTVGEVAAVRDNPKPRVKGGKQLPDLEPPSAVASAGVELKGLRVLPRKPADNAATFIKRLPQGKGFEPRVLAAEWGVSEETVRLHAKSLRCLKFVEVNDEWLPMVMHPETAGRYHS